MELRYHVKSVVVFLFESEPQRAMLIEDELRRLVTELKEIGLRYSNQPLTVDANNIDEELRQPPPAEVLISSSSSENQQDLGPQFILSVPESDVVAQRCSRTVAEEVMNATALGNSLEVRLFPLRLLLSAQNQSNHWRRPVMMVGLQC